MKRKKKKKIIKPWQEVITHWKEWKHSTDEAREVVLSKHGEQIKILTAEEPESLDQLIDEVADMGYEFVIKEIGLRPESDYFEDFMFTWMHLVLDEISDEYDRNFILTGELAEKDKIWIDNKPETRKGKVVIISSINWVKGKVRRGELLKKMKDKDWPPSGLFKSKGKGGRPSKKDLTNMEAIVCVLLKDRANVQYINIGKLFGWDITKNAYDKHRVCQTARDRVTLGRELLK